MKQRWWQWEHRKEDLSEELEAHLRLAVEDRIARGEDPAEARAAALREIGNLPLVADTTRRQWGWEWAERTGKDLRHAARRLWHSPGYSVTVLLTLTLAIGANTAIFGLLYALMLRSLPVDHPDRIVQLATQMTGPELHDGGPGEYLSGKLYDTVRGHQTLMSGMCAWSMNSVNLHEPSGTQPLSIVALTGDCFRTLGLHPALGRLFDESDDKPGGGPEGWAVVLSYDYWHSKLNADPGVLGRVLNFGDKKGVIVGVLEPGFESVQVGQQPPLFLPSEVSGPQNRHNLGVRNSLLLGRLKDGATVAQVQAQLDPIFQAQMKEESHRFESFVFDQDGKRMTVTGERLLALPGRTGSSYLREAFAKPLYLIEGMVGLSLLVACAYLATLAATRARARRRELGVRLALGASRARLAAELCYESALLAVTGTLLGLLFAWGAGRALVHMLDEPGADSSLALHTDPTGIVLLFALGLTVLTVLLAGVLPAWQASRVDPSLAIKEGAIRTGRRGLRRVGSWLTPLQIGVSLVIVVIAALMASTVVRLLAVNPGFRTSGVVFTGADLSDRVRQMKSANQNKDDEQIPSALVIALLDRIQHSPGVESAAVTQAYQMGGAMYMRSASATLPSGEVRKGQMQLNLTVSPGFFSTMGIPLLKGRDFTLNDKKGAPEVCVLSRSAADYLFPGTDAVGKTVDMGGDGGKVGHVTVVGIAGDTLYMGLRGKAPQLIYQPYFGAMGWNPYPKFAVRATDTRAAVTGVRSAFKDLAPDVPLSQPVTMSQLVQGAMGRERMLALLSTFFAVLTLTLSAIGIYGLLNASVLRRRREIGVRMALGASRSGVVRLVASEAAWMVVPGLLLGVAGAWGATRLLQTLLYGVKPLDPWACVGSLVLLAAASAIACALPARRAASLDPLVALRHE